MLEGPGDNFSYRDDAEKNAIREDLKEERLTWIKRLMLFDCFAFLFELID